MQKSNKLFYQYHLSILLFVFSRNGSVGSTDISFGPDSFIGRSLEIWKRRHTVGSNWYSSEVKDTALVVEKIPHIYHWVHWRLADVFKYRLIKWVHLIIFCTLVSYNKKTNWILQTGTASTVSVYYLIMIAQPSSQPWDY